MSPVVHRLAGKFRTIVRSDRFGCTAQCNHTLQLFRDLLSGLRSVRMGAQAFSRVLIDDRQNAKPSPVHQPVTYKVHAPPLIRITRFCKPDPRLGRSLGPLLDPQLQPFFPVESVNTLSIYMPTFSPQQHRQSPITVADSGGSQIPQSHSQLRLGIATALITIRPARDAHQPASAQFIQLIRLSYLAHQFAALGGLQAFFESTSCRMCLSNVRSATMLFSLRFSSRSCRSSRTSFNPNPPYRRFHL